jgi:copper chaperone CopZ
LGYLTIGITMTSINRIETKVLAVEGMNCEHCVMSVTGALKALKGVRIVKVDLMSKKAEVTYDPDEVDEKKMIKAVVKAGFKAKVGK